MIPYQIWKIALVVTTKFTQSSAGSSITLDVALSPTLPENTNSTPSSPTASNGEAAPASQIHIVKVGAGGFQFEPAKLDNVSVGDIVMFEFYPSDHSVARAEYGSACIPYEYTGKDKTGFWSGTRWVKTLGDITHWNLTINSTEPVFYYCAAPNACRGRLMIGAINSNSTQTIDAQIQAAREAAIQVAPGETVPNEATSTTSSTSLNNSHTRLARGALVGIVIGSIMILTFCVGLLLFMMRRSKKSSGETKTGYTHSQGPLSPVLATINRASLNSPISPPLSPPDGSSAYFNALQPVPHDPQNPVILELEATELPAKY